MPPLTRRRIAAENSSPEGARPTKLNFVVAAPLKKSKSQQEKEEKLKKKLIGPLYVPPNLKQTAISSWFLQPVKAPKKHDDVDPAHTHEIIRTVVEKLRQSLVNGVTPEGVSKDRFRKYETLWKTDGDSTEEIEARLIQHLRPDIVELLAKWKAGDIKSLEELAPIG